MCIICFIKDEYQFDLRKSAQFRSDRYEHCIDKYRKSFLRIFDKEKEVLCAKHNNANNSLIQKYIKKIDSTEINNCFDSIINIYFNWIDSNLSNAINEFEQMIYKYDLLSQKIDISHKIMFRGRASENFISHWDMFHIPFNKRFKIQNQRYSLVGQPLLYLTESPFGVINELNATENIRISTFRLIRKNHFYIFDNSNQFYNIIQENSDTIFSDLKSIINYAEYNINSKIVKNYFFHLIISSCCSFQKRSELKNSSFCEEYVIPQIFAQCIKGKNKFNGIFYTSSKFDSFLCKHISDYLYKNFFGNIALFTEYDKKYLKDETYVYDKKLYSKFKISNPVLYNSFIDCEINDILEMIKDIPINDLYKDCIYDINKLLIEYQTFLFNLYLIDDFSEDFSEDQKNSLYTNIKLHCFSLNNILLNINDKIYYDTI